MIKVEFETKDDKFPKVREIVINKAYKGSRPSYVESPVGNCQTFSILYMYRLLQVSDDDFKFLLKELFEEVGRKQLFTDVKEENSAKVITKFTPYATNIISTPYKSTNGSNMVMHLIQLDIHTLGLDK